MKIKKFTTLNEGLEKNYYLLTKHQRSDGDEYFHLFDSYEILFDYVVCEIYFQLKNYPKALDDFDKQDFDGDLDAIFEYFDQYIEKYNTDVITYEDIDIEKEVKFEDWMKIRLNARKYNI
jgi:hypothetical protein